VAVLLGYTKWKVARSEKRLEQLKSEGLAVSVTSRETSWLEYLATGKKNIRVAGQMFLSVRTFDDGYLIGDRLPFSEEHLTKEEVLPKVKDLVDRINTLENPKFYIRVLGDDRDEKLERELRRISGARVEWLPPAISEYGEFY
jgi:hypothetical protein